MPFSSGFEAAFVRADVFNGVTTANNVSSFLVEVYVRKYTGEKIAIDRSKFKFRKVLLSCSFYS